jgi:surface antigen
MKYLTSAILAASFAVSSAQALASAPQGTDIEASTRLTMKQCLAMQAAKNDGASRADMKNACQWTTEETDSNAMSSGEKPRAVDSAPYGLLPSTVTPPR